MSTTTYDWVQVVDPASKHTFFANPVSCVHHSNVDKCALLKHPIMIYQATGECQTEKPQSGTM